MSDIINILNGHKQLLQFPLNFTLFLQNSDRLQVSNQTPHNYFRQIIFFFIFRNLNS